MGYKLKATLYLARRKRAHTYKTLVSGLPTCAGLLVTMFAAAFAVVCLLVSRTVPQPLISVIGL